MTWYVIARAIYEWLFTPYANPIKMEQYGSWKTKQIFEPMYRCCGPHIQTIYDTMHLPWRRSKPVVNYTRDYMMSRHKVMVALDWVNNECDKEVVLICPGIGGRSTDISVLNLVSHFSKTFSVCVYNRENTLALPSKANVQELHDVIQCITHPNRHGLARVVHVVGISASGNLVLKYAGEVENNRVKSIIAISNAVDLVAMRSKFTFEKWVDYALYEKNGHWFHTPSIIALENAMLYRDTSYTSIYDCYSKNSSRHDLKHIVTPTLYLASRDDPFLDKHQFELMIEATKENPYINVILTSHGGHVGWVSRTTNAWYTNVIDEFIQRYN